MGKLVLLTLPIGNIDDITKRVLNSLLEAKTLIAEDTRTIKNQLNKLSIDSSNKKIISFHDQSGETKTKNLLEELEHSDLYLVSEAGSPYISDPAYPLVKMALELGYEVDSYSGISAVTQSLELSGLPPIPFHFHGFPPRDSGKRKAYFQKEVASVYGTHIFFEGG
jgi:16S rRNA (cytidine1402-2'-O)-methyltransferase